MADFERMGVSRQQVLAAMPARAANKAGDADLVLPVHLVPPVRLAGELRTQMRVGVEKGSVVFLGIDYAARDATMRALGMPRRGPKAEVLLGQFRVVEVELTRLMNCGRV